MHPFEPVFEVNYRFKIQIFFPVLPSFSVHVEPQMNYISYGQFNNFVFKVSAR